MALLIGALALAACGSSGSATSSGDVTNPPPTTDATSSAANGAGGTDTQGGDVVTEGANGSNNLGGPGDASGGNAGNDAGNATDVGSGSDGAQGSGGSDQAGGSQAPNQPNGAVTQGDATGNSASGTGDTGSSQGTVTDTQGSVNAGAAVTGTTGTTGTQAGPAGAAAGGYTPIADAECTEVQNQLTQALGIDVSRNTAPAAFQDLSGGTGQSCQLTIAATGAQFPNMVDAGQRIAGALTPNGWTLDPQYAADSPTGTMHGLRRNNQLAVYNVQWAPAAGVTCPADQPIATCAESLTPDQMTYTITVDLAQQ